MSIESLPIVKNRSYLEFEGMKFMNGSYCNALKYVHFSCSYTGSAYISIHFDSAKLSEVLLKDPFLTDLLKETDYDISRISNDSYNDISITFWICGAGNKGKLSDCNYVYSIIGYLINSSFPNYEQFFKMKQAKNELPKLVNKFNSFELSRGNSWETIDLQTKYQSDIRDIEKYHELKENMDHLLSKLKKIENMYVIRVKRAKEFIKEMRECLQSKQY